MYSRSSSNQELRKRPEHSIRSSKSRPTLKNEKERNGRKAKAHAHSNNLPLKKGGNADKEKKTGQLGKSGKYHSKTSRQNKNKYKESFTFNYGNYVKQSKKNANLSPSSSKQKQKKSKLANLGGRGRDQDMVNQIKRLYMKEIESQHSNSNRHTKRSPNRSKFSELDNRSEDSFSQMSEFSEFSKTNSARPKDSLFHLGSAQRRPRTNRARAQGLRKSDNSLEGGFMSQAGQKSFDAVELENDEFIEIQGIGSSRKNPKSKGSRDQRPRGRRGRGGRGGRSNRQKRGGRSRRRIRK